MFSDPDLNSTLVDSLVLTLRTIQLHFSAILPSSPSSYLSVSTASNLLSDCHICTILLTFIQISTYPSIHNLSSAMSKLHNSRSLLCVCAVCVHVLSSANAEYQIKEIHANLVNAVLTGLSCNDKGCVLPLLYATFHFPQKGYATTALLMMCVRQTHTRHLLYATFLIEIVQRDQFILKYSCLLCFSHQSSYHWTWHIIHDIVSFSLLFSPIVSVDRSARISLKKCKSKLCVFLLIHKDHAWTAATHDYAGTF